MLSVHEGALKDETPQYNYGRDGRDEPVSG
jgi:hypothetical protein